MAAWLAALPYPLLDGYALDPVDATVRTDMEMGAARARRRTAARNDKVKTSWLFSDAQMALFRAWFDDPAQAAGGAAWFDVSLTIGTGGTVAKVCRFVGPFQATLIGGQNWHVTASLEVR